jgi:hypothetical protein
MAEMTPVERDDGWAVVLGEDALITGLPSNAAAWSWIDRNTDSGRAHTEQYLRIRTAFSDPEAIAKRKRSRPGSRRKWRPRQ